jgi:hypothetical protein
MISIVETPLKRQKTCFSLSFRMRRKQKKKKMGLKKLIKKRGKLLQKTVQLSIQKALRIKIQKQLERARLILYENLLFLISKMTPRFTWCAMRPT